MNPDEVKKMLDDYRALAETSGAILFAYMRGKFSEGIDFKDDHARALVTVGIPYLPKSDVFVSQKIKYQDGRNMEKPECLSGSEWYTSNAFKALNQTIGRNIRHIDDWGSIFMLHTWLDKDCNQKKLPNWIRVTLANWGGEEEVKPWREVSPKFFGFVEEFKK
ncbi:unnamed protein product [Allacma fusca]|uniref:ATP-dependent helicase C-terminal domain-containing protein n=1 Tax=Allacma fusca TaxID=39272 RepID=A0A8J2NXR6_9HEXA|nr:unnamed protein product [Allacma fusca]